MRISVGDVAAVCAGLGIPRTVLAREAAHRYMSGDTSAEAVAAWERHGAGTRSCRSCGAEA